MYRAKKEQAVHEVAEKLRKALGIYLVDFTGLNVAEANELRRRFREAGVEYRVVKNSFTRLALKEAGLVALSDYLTGPTGISLGYQDPVSPAKILLEFMKGKNAPRVRAGFVEGMVISPEEVERLSELPSKGVLLEQLASSLVFPPAALVSTLQGILSGLVGILEAIGARKAELFETHSIPK